MSRILKFRLLPGRTTLALPAGAVPRFVHEQRDDLCLWVECPDGEHDQRRAFVVVATGEHFDGGAYVGTATMDGASLVWHVFEVPAP